MNLKMKDVMTANCQIPNAEMLTSNHCAALARELNKLLADALAAQRDEGLAREAELQESKDRLDTKLSCKSGHVLAYKLSRQRLLSRARARELHIQALQQRLAEAESGQFGLCMMVAEAAYKAGLGRDRAVASDVLRQVVESVIARPDCADGEKP